MLYASSGSFLFERCMKTSTVLPVKVNEVFQFYGNTRVCFFMWVISKSICLLYVLTNSSFGAILCNLLFLNWIKPMPLKVFRGKWQTADGLKAVKKMNGSFLKGTFICLRLMFTKSFLSLSLKKTRRSSKVKSKVNFVLSHWLNKGQNIYF